jgi:dolichyl-phosphate-mannose--protein O-mannosyl transferase
VLESGRQDGLKIRWAIAREGSSPSPGTMTLTKKDYIFALIIFTLALSLRLPYISHPPVTVFDEGIYATFASSVVHNRPFFFAHPPLAGLIFGAVSSTKEFVHAELYGVKLSFDTFPFERVRVSSAIAGSFLAVVVFFIARMIWSNILFGIISSLLVVFDSALITYSRLVLPDIWILLFGFGGVMLTFIAIKRQCFVYAVLAGLLLGLAISIKWSALGFFAFCVLLFVREKKYMKAIIITLVMISVFIIILEVFYSVQPQESIQTNFGDIVYPGRGIIEGFSYIPRHALLMIKGHGDVPHHIHSSHPYSWPFGRKPIGLWGEDEKKIVLSPNSIAWGAVYFSIIVVSLFVILRSKQEDFDSHKLLVAGYMLSYVPFFYVAHPLFVYHYFIPLIFGYLLVPATLNMLGRRAIYVFIISVIAYTVILAPLVYGF